jgi:hypothetical protein
MSGRFGHNTMVYPMCTTLPMGWSHSVYLAQQCHNFIANEFAGFKPQDRVAPGNDFLLNRIRFLLYIDDAILVAPRRLQQQLLKLQEFYVSVMAGRNLPPNQRKIQVPTDLHVEALGLEIDGVNRTFGLSATKLQSLVSDTLGLLAQRYCDGQTLRKLVGR